MSYAPNPGYPPIPPAQEKRGNGLGIASLIVGIVAFVGSFIPILNFVTGFVAFAGLVLGVIALFLKNRRRGTAIAGSVVSLIALILSIVLATVYTAGFAGAVSDAIESSSSEPFITSAPLDSESPNAEAPEEATSTVVYEVTAEGSATAGTISYTTVDDGSVGQEQATDAALPFTKEIALKGAGAFSYGSYTIVAQAAAGSTSISCKITVDGEVVAEQTSTGEYAVVTCNANG